MVKRKIWVTTDTHFGHKPLLVDKLHARLSDYEDRIIEGWKRNVQPTDTIIHLGDIAFTTESNNHFHKLLQETLPGAPKVLVKGNHDKKSNNWYLNNGWDFVCETFSIDAYGHNIIFSHIPYYPKDPFSINIHGHFHNNGHRDYASYPQLNSRTEEEARRNGYILLSLENDGYSPLPLRTIIEVHDYIMQRRDLPT